MTLETLLKQIHILVEGDTDYPTSGDDYDRRIARVSDAIDIYDSEGNVVWRELFVSLADASDGDKTLVNGQTEYDAPSDFRWPVGYLRVYNGSAYNYYELVDAKNIQLYSNDTSTKIWWITGNKSTGYKIHISPTPGSSEDGKTIKYEYYKEPTKPTSDSDVIEMSMPSFIKYWVAAAEVRDEDPALASRYEQIAINILESMKLKNDAPAPWQSSALEDNYNGFGE